MEEIMGVIVDVPLIDVNEALYRVNKGCQDIHSFSTLGSTTYLSIECKKAGYPDYFFMFFEQKKIKRTQKSTIFHFFSNKKLSELIWSVQK